MPGASTRKALIRRDPATTLNQRIRFVRGERILLGTDLADLYGVETKTLHRAVRRNIERFPADFMFALTDREWKNLRYQIGTSSSAHGGGRYRPLAFTEHGVAMLSSVLRSRRAVAANIAIMRAFTRLRALLTTHRELARRLNSLERKYDGQFAAVFDAIRKLMAAPTEPSRRRIGFVRADDPPAAPRSTAMGRRRATPNRP